MKLNVFISSTCYDLGSIRAQLRNSLTDLGHAPVLSDYGDVLFDPRSHTHKSCLNEVANADVLVLIIGGRFGGAAVPQALSELKPGPLSSTPISITQAEAMCAIERDIPIYTFVKKAVLSDHETYEKTKISLPSLSPTPTFHSIEKQNTATFIFEFINFVRRRQNNNAIYPFTSVKQIKSILQGQWSAYFRQLLKEQIAAKDLNSVRIKRVSYAGSTDTAALKPLIASATKVKVMFTSGATFLATHHDDLRACVLRGGEVTVLLASANSPFVTDLEGLEGRGGGSSPISTEIKNSVERLGRIVSEAKNHAAVTTALGSIKYGHYGTHLRLSLIIIDDRYCYAILCYSPKRTSEALAFLFDISDEATDHPVGRHMLEHFDAVHLAIRSSGSIKDA